MIIAGVSADNIIEEHPGVGGDNYARVTGGDNYARMAGGGDKTFQSYQSHTGTGNILYTASTCL